MEGQGTEVAPGLHRIEVPLGERYVACYLVLGQDSAMLVDTGIAGTFRRSIMPYATSIGVAVERIRWVVVTHADVDHMGGNATLRAVVPDATLVAHEADRALIEDVDRMVEDRYREFTTAHDIDMDQGMIAWCHEVAEATPIGLSITAAVGIDLGGRRLEVIPTPGHSPGSISVWDASTGSAMTSDAVLGSSLHLADGRPAFPPTYRLPGRYRATIADLDARAPTWLLTAHEPVMGAAAARAFLAESRDFCDRLEAAALQELGAAGPLTTRELIRRLAPRVGQWEPSVWDLLAYGLVGHLEELEASGAIVVLEGWPVRWALAPTGGT